MNIVDLYSSILSYAGLEANKEGYVSIIKYRNEDKELLPLYIENKRLVLPTQEQLRAFDGNNQIVFHPLMENIIRGESKVITKLKESIDIRINMVLGIVVQNLLQILASPAQHASLNPDQAELLTVINDCDEKTVIEFTKIMLSVFKQSNKRFFSVYLKRGGSIDNTKYSRLGIVLFPLYQELLDDNVALSRIKDKKAFKAIFEFVLPNIAKDNAYSYGSDSRVAPFLDALLKSTANVASRLNDIIDLYKDYIENYDQLIFNSDWFESFMNLDSLLPEIRRIPMLDGNIGPIEQESSTARTVIPNVTPVQQGYTPINPQPVVSQPEIRKTKNGLDFSSIVAANPTLQNMPNPFASFNPHMVQRPPSPSWATNPNNFMDSYNRSQGHVSQQPNQPNQWNQQGYYDPNQALNRSI